MHSEDHNDNDLKFFKIFTCGLYRLPIPLPYNTTQSKSDIFSKRLFSLNVSSRHRESLQKTVQ